MSTTCKFFLQGTCKFGDNCKFSHQINDSIQSQSTSIMRQQAKPPAVDTNLLVRSVVTDMTNAEKGGHWLLSSYAPFKDKPWFPGFENRSFEEVRCGHYESIKNGTAEQYKMQLQVALQEAAMKMKALQNPTNEIVQMLIQIYNSPVNNPYSSQPSPFSQNQQQTPSIFAVANQNLFGNTANQQGFGGSHTNNVFMGNQPEPSSMFAAAPIVNKSIFAGGQTAVNNQSIFAAANHALDTNQSIQIGSPFAAQSNFAQPNTFVTQTQNSPFALPTQTNSPFNQGQPTNSIFAAQNLQSNFTNMVNPNSPLPFSGQQQQSIFASSPPQQTSPFAERSNNAGNNIFNAQAPTNVFAGQTSIFGNPQTTTEQKLTNSIFAQTSSVPSTVFGESAEAIDSTVYSKLEDLSENDIKSFQSDSFEFGKIPEKPPTAQMCL